MLGVEGARRRRAYRAGELLVLGAVEFAGLGFNNEGGKPSQQAEAEKLF